MSQQRDSPRPAKQVYSFIFSPFFVTLFCYSRRFSKSFTVELSLALSLWRCVSLGPISPRHTTSNRVPVVFYPRSMTSTQLCSYRYKCKLVIHLTLNCLHAFRLLIHSSKKPYLIEETISSRCHEILWTVSATRVQDQAQILQKIQQLRNGIYILFIIATIENNNKEGETMTVNGIHHSQCLMFVIKLQILSILLKLTLL